MSNVNGSIKQIKDKILDGVGFTPEDISYLASITNNFNSGNSKFDDTDIPTMENYAEFIKNYLYTYKDEATDIDPSIDTNEQHIGPMAQDIEHVAPDCIKETPEGIKEVDGNRLALVNAGVIGDISRKIIQLERRILDLEEKLI